MVSICMVHTDRRTVEAARLRHGKTTSNTPLLRVDSDSSHSVSLTRRIAASVRPP